MAVRGARASLASQGHPPATGGGAPPAVWARWQRGGGRRLCERRACPLRRGLHHRGIASRALQGESGGPDKGSSGRRSPLCSPAGERRRRPGAPRLSPAWERGGGPAVRAAQSPEHEPAGLPALQPPGTGEAGRSRRRSAEHRPPGAAPDARPPAVAQACCSRASPLCDRGRPAPA